MHLCRVFACLTEEMLYAQAGRSDQQKRAYHKQPVYTSMAGEDGSLVMLDPLFTDGDEVLPQKQQEPFVFLDDIPQVGSFSQWVCWTALAPLSVECRSLMSVDTCPSVDTPSLFSASAAHSPCSYLGHLAVHSHHTHFYLPCQSALVILSMWKLLAHFDAGECKLISVWLPQEAYGRVKLCNTMVADHFIPAYLASLGSVIESLEHDM